MNLRTPLLALCLGLATTVAHANGVLTFDRMWTHTHVATGGKPAVAAEIPAFDARTDTLWIAGVVGIDILDRSTGALVASLDTRSLGAINSVSIFNGVAAMAFENSSDRTQPGQVVLFDTTTRTFTGGSLIAGQNQFTVGALPDMLTFTPDGMKILVANEGTPAVYGSEILPRAANLKRNYGPASNDPPGSVSIIDLTTNTVTTVGFAGVPITGANVRTNTGMDFEPEYIAVSPDGKKAFVTLQEANALAILDLSSNTFEKVVGLGAKDFSLPGNEIDSVFNDGKIEFLSVNAKGLYQPDSIASFEKDGKVFLVMANEGDFREDDADRSTGGTFGRSAPLNTLRILNTDSATDGDIFTAGARSFSIRDADGNLIYDSGSILDREAARLGIYDDNRSRDKGVEPEGVDLLEIGNRLYAFIGLERTLQGAVAVFDITDPYAVQYIDMIVTEGDRAPEGLKAFSLGGEHYLAIANEVSNTTTLYRLAAVPAQVSEPASLALMLAGFGAAAAFARRRKGRAVSH